MNKQLEQQNFHEVEVTSGFIMKLIKQTQENIRLGKQTINEKGNNVYNRLSKPKNKKFSNQELESFLNKMME
jgi:hypothetical protein